MTVLKNNAWKYLFSERILERGEEYADAGLIYNIVKTKNGWKANARGSRIYNVGIETDGEKITDMYCSCPYAEDYTSCKHMAGLLFTLTEEADEPEESETLEDVLNGMSEDELRKELTRIAKSDLNTAVKLINTYAKHKPGINEAEAVYRALDVLAFDYADRYGFIDWKNGMDYAYAFCDTMRETIEPLIERGAYDSAFEALDKAFYILNNVAMDGSSGEHSKIADRIEEYWHQIIHLASPEERDRFHDWFEAMEKQAGRLICGDSITRILEGSFDDPKYLDPLLKNVRIALDEQKTNSRKTRILLEKMCNLLRRRGMDNSEYEDWLKENEDLKAVKELRLEQAETRNDTDAQAAILQDLIDIEEHQWEKRGYLEKLLAVYQKTENHEKEKEVLRVLLFETGVKNVGYFRRLRVLTDPGHWEKVREFYLSAHPDLKPEIYAEEKEYDRLMEAVREREIDVADRYRNLLENRYPKEIREIYLKYLQQLEQEHPCAGIYQKMENYLLTAASIKGGVPQVLRLINRWRREYPTRKKMLEMLDKTEIMIRNL